MVLELRIFVCSKCTWVYNERDECEVHENKDHQTQPHLWSDTDSSVLPISDECRPPFPLQNTFAVDRAVSTLFESVNSETDVPMIVTQDVQQLSAAAAAIAKPFDALAKTSAGGVRCDICNVQCDGEMGYFRHFSRMHNKERSFIFPCRFCSKTFNKRGACLEHERFVHIDNEAFRCKKCDYLARSKGNYVKHLQTHSDERPFPCDVCGKMFKFRKAVTKHKLTHVKTINVIPAE